jgi:hypothetical protein
MRELRLYTWGIRITLILSLIGIIVASVLENLSIDQRITAIGIALQICGISLSIPELARRISGKPATDLVIAMNTFDFLPLLLGKIGFNKILDRMKIRYPKTIGEMNYTTAILGIALIFVGLIMQYIGFIKD